MHALLARKINNPDERLRGESVGNVVGYEWNTHN